MARLHLTVGTRYEGGTQAHVVRQILLDGHLLVENLARGEQLTTTRDELCAAWARGEVTFEVRGRHAQPAAGRPFATGYTITDFGQLPEKQRAEAWRRYELIKPLLARPPRERTRRVIAAHVAAYHASAAPTGEDLARISRTSVERYLRAFEESGGDIRTLVPATQRQGGKGHSRLHTDLEHLVQEVLAECAAAPAYRTGRDVYLMIVNRVRDANLRRSDEDQLALPGRATLYRRIGQAGTVTILRRKASRRDAQTDQVVHPGPRTTHILQRVEIDHTTLDLIVVDEGDRMPIGRPTVTLALDTFSGFPVGLTVGFEPPSYLAAARCLLQAILPKEQVQERYGTAHPWPTYGLPETLVVDHARHLIGHDLRDACAQLDIQLDPMPVDRPWFKGAIERQFRTHNTGLVHTLPGTTFSDVLARGDDDPGKQACISLARFWEILMVYLLDVYAQDWHTGIGGVPAQRWAESLQAGHAPALAHDARELRILLGRTARRTVQRTGIDLACLRYQSRDLGDLRQRLPANEKVTCKYDPDDLSALHVFDPTGAGQWLRVPSVDQDYTRGLSLWKHRVIHAYVVQRMKTEVDVYALAAAKAHIQELVADEFRRTRTTRRRTRAAWLLGIGTDTPAVPSPVAAQPGPRATTPPVVPPPVLVESDAFRPDEEAGWGADYGLPRGRAVRPWT